jgi:hypothetical protein
MAISHFLETVENVHPEFLRKPKRHVLKPETTGTKPPEQPEQESEKTGTTETKIEHGIPPP